MKRVGGGWRDGAVVKSAYWLPRRPRFHSQHPTVALTIAHHSKSRERIPLTSEGPSMHIVYINTWHTYIVNLRKKKIVGKLDMLEGCKVRSSKSSSAK